MFVIIEYKYSEFPNVWKKDVSIMEIGITIYHPSTLKQKKMNSL